MVGWPHGRGTGLDRGRCRVAPGARPGTPAATQRRVAILLIGGKTGDDRWYDVNVPLADRLYEEHLEILKREEHRRGSE